MSWVMGHLGSVSCRLYAVRIAEILIHHRDAEAQRILIFFLSVERAERKKPISSILVHSAKPYRNLPGKAQVKFVEDYIIESITHRANKQQYNSFGILTSPFRPRRARGPKPRKRKEHPEDPVHPVRKKRAACSSSRPRPVTSPVHRTQYSYPVDYPSWSRRYSARRGFS